MVFFPSQNIPWKILLSTCLNNSFVDIFLDIQVPEGASDEHGTTKGPTGSLCNSNQRQNKFHVLVSLCRFPFNFWRSENSLWAFFNPADPECSRLGTVLRPEHSPSQRNFCFSLRTFFFSSHYRLTGRVVFMMWPAAVIADKLQNLFPKPVKEAGRESRTQGYTLPQLCENSSHGQRVWKALPDGPHCPVFCQS